MNNDTTATTIVNETQAYAYSYEVGTADDVDALIAAIIVDNPDQAGTSTSTSTSTDTGADGAGGTAVAARHGWWLRDGHGSAVEVDDTTPAVSELLWPPPEWSALTWLELPPTPTLPTPTLPPPAPSAARSRVFYPDPAGNPAPGPLLPAPHRHAAELLVAAASAPYALSYDPLAGPVLQVKSGFDIAGSVLDALATPGALAELLAYFAARGITPTH